MPVTMVKGVRKNEQPGDLECQRGNICDCTTSLTRGSSLRTPTKGMIPVTRSGPVAAADAWEPVEPAEARESDEPAEAREPNEPTEVRERDEPAEAWEPAEPTESCEPDEPAKAWKPDAQAEAS